MRKRTLLCLSTAVIIAVIACTPHPYTAAAYRNVDTSVAYAIICHNGKRTLRIPEDEWPSHKVHYDYRGPCRPRGAPSPRPAPKPKHTTVTYDQRRPRAAWSKEEWVRHQEARAQLLARDTVGVGPVRK